MRRPAEADSIPGFGVGVQWIAALENMIVVRVDQAVGRDGSHGFYVGIS